MSATANKTGNQEPVILWMSILAGLQMFFSGGAGVSVLMDNEMFAAILAVGGLAVASAQVGVQFYVRGEVTVNSNVVEYRTSDGRVIAGAGHDGLSEGEPIREVGTSKLDRLDGVE